MSYLKTVGAALLVAGTAIGGGMLALPVITGIYGFYSATLLMIGTWGVNTYIAFLLLEANLWLKPGSSITSMARATLGKGGTITAWISGVLFLYTLLVAYISGLSEICLEIIHHVFNLGIPDGIVYFLITSIFAWFIYRGTNIADYVNRFFSVGMVISVFILLGLLFPHIDINKISNTHLQWPLTTLPVVFTSFGFMIIIPSIREYLDSNVKQLKLAIFIGSLIPLTLYLVWEFMILAIIPVDGLLGLFFILQHGDPGTGLTNSLNKLVTDPLLTKSIRFFIISAVATSLIGSALGLFDFISDGLNIEKNSIGRFKAALLTFLPPLIFATLFKGIFIEALGYAGVFSVILLSILPTLIVWKGRNMFKKISNFQVIGGRITLVSILLFSLLLIIMQLIHAINVFIPQLMR